MPDRISSLEDLPPLLREEPALVATLGRRDATLAVSEAARGLVLANLATRGGRHPDVVIVARSVDAERLSRDLATFLGAGAVAHFGAWETLPFERISPTAETMARRNEVLWRLRGDEEGDPDRVPRVIVAPVRSLTQRLAPPAPAHDPMTVSHGDRIDRDELDCLACRSGLPARGSGRAPG